MKAYYKEILFPFANPLGTSRGTLHAKEVFFVFVEKDGFTGIGETGLFASLSFDDVPHYREKLSWACQNIALPWEELSQELKEFPSIVFGLEQALLSLKNRSMELFPSDFTLGKQGIAINGLIWMGDSAFVQSQIQKKLEVGYSCIKMKIGVDWPSELAILEGLRKRFPKETLEIRVDANGAFSFLDAKEVLKKLQDLQIHSIEQPIKKGQIQEMASLANLGACPVVLDEELIGVLDFENQKTLLKTISPKYVIFKPSLIGGFEKTDRWISLCSELGIGWWITSALETNIGLSAISQYTFTKNSPMFQGLGTGGLFTQNVPSPLELKGQELFYNPEKPWKLPS
ncbi:MAG: o-succinylbenzoate synthase [Flavobacteriaceae bacterium]|nr:MAG: o-succinylbenzoate synthase [Flavobacteriaceae bacterium]